MISIEKEKRPWGQFFVIHDESNYKLKRIEAMKTDKKFQTAEKLRGLLNFRRFSDQMNRLGAAYFWKIC